MKIAVNYSIFYQQRFGGISNYFFNLYKKLFSKRVDCKFFAPLHQNNYLKELDNDKISGIHLQYFPSIINPIIDQINYKISNFQIKRYNPDILHLSYYDQKKNTRILKEKKFVPYMILFLKDFQNFLLTIKNYTMRNMKL